MKNIHYKIKYWSLRPDEIENVKQLPASSGFIWIATFLRMQCCTANGSSWNKWEKRITQVVWRVLILRDSRRIFTFDWMGSSQDLIEVEVLRRVLMLSFRSFHMLSCVVMHLNVYSEDICSYTLHEILLFKCHSSYFFIRTCSFYVIALFHFYLTTHWIYTSMKRLIIVSFLSLVQFIVMDGYFSFFTNIFL